VQRLAVSAERDGVVAFVADTEILSVAAGSWGSGWAPLPLI
jgi:hypothetical protein